MKPLLILDNFFRKRDELFSAGAYHDLCALCDVRGGQDAPMTRAEVEALLPEAAFYVASHPQLTSEELDRAPNLRATIEVAGAFREGLDYAGCFARGVEVLSCAPGFRNAVSEMALAMMLSAGRGLVAEHEAFRQGRERWLDDREGTDFTLYGQSVGFIGYGQIARETHRLLRPFGAKVMAYDPYAQEVGPDAELVSLACLAQKCRVIIVAAVPSEETAGLLNAELIAALQPQALVVVISRAWCVDFPALVAAAQSGRIQLATDVFPDEPLAPSDPLRRMRNVILSPHRAAAVPGGRHLIGEMIVHDVRAILEGRAGRDLKTAQAAEIEGLVAAQAKMSAMPNT